MRRSTLTLFCAVLVLLMALSGNVHASKMIPKEQKPQKKKANKETEMMKGKLSKKEKNTSEAEPVCAWDKYYKECFVRPQPTINALFDTKKEFATIVGRALECIYTYDRRKCNANPSCAWDNEDEECGFADWVTGFEDSPCFQNAPLLFTESTAYYDCPQIQSRKTCRKDSLCYWDDDGCTVDSLMIYLGISDDDYSKAIDVITDEIYDAFGTEYNVSDPNLDYSTILEWELPETECPEDVNEKACDIADDLYDILLPELYYCYFKYYDLDNPDQCNADPLCEIDETDGTCGMRNWLERLARVLYKKMISNAENKGDRAAFALYLKCTTFSEDRCPETCKWDAKEESCFPTTRRLYESLVVDDHGNDGFCDYLSLFANTDCYEFSNLHECNKDETCTWDRKDCGLSAAYAVKAVADRYKGLSNKLKQFDNACFDKETKQTCIESTI